MQITHVFSLIKWKNHTGYSAVYSQYLNKKVLEDSITDPEILEDFMIDEGETPVGASVKGSGMKLSFNNCDFKVSNCQSQCERFILWILLNNVIHFSCC